ncbi:MAG: threonine--tRNA ligase [Gammaproteobacteria bacterium]|uniref:Threonine--tRNA ligase n=1 Tax=SAR86 cluster bacterium TaxID=2030880 RepID=A0A520MRB1_9GAMM|nr:MAG: threonine--tRNA ligase [SAR86 cluster bacterium]
MDITLPDGSKKSLPKGSNGLDLAKSIGPGLAKDAVAVVVNNEQRDLSDKLSTNAEVSIITIKSNEGLEIMRHTLAAQVLASAIKNLYPDAKLAIGPTIEDGFYYDFLPTKPISIDDLPNIEKEMKSIIGQSTQITKTYHSKNDAIAMFDNLDEGFKAEIINDSDQADNFQIYAQDNSGFIDLCRGPHLPHLGFIGEFKLTKVSGAYWRGDSDKPMLTRIYGTAWNNKKDLTKYLERLEKAEEVDHRKLGKEMDLFHFQEEAPGMVFWHPKGWTIYTQLQHYVREMQKQAGYREVNTPEVVDRKLWEKSGHWDKYRENMFITEIDEEHANEKRTNALKPMNCPNHVQIYNQGIKSYRDLPFRLAEFGKCHRYEASGTMHGLMRVRGFTQDDAHIFCTEDQIESETKNFIDLLSKMYSDLGFTNFNIKLSTRPEKRIGSDASWDKSEKALQDAIEKLKLPYTIDEGDGAFYGPKLDFVLTDAIGRKWQCGTLQVDFNLPGRFDSTYVGADGSKHTPVLLHRAALGSFERFIGILLENYGGKLPLWLSPTQTVIAAITDEANDYAEELNQTLLSHKLRSEVDVRNEQISYKVREHSLNKVPYIIAVGKKEVADKTVSVRKLGSDKNTVMSADGFVNEIVNGSKNPLDT